MKHGIKKKATCLYNWWHDFGEEKGGLEERGEFGGGWHEDQYERQTHLIGRLVKKKSKR